MGFHGPRRPEDGATPDGGRDLDAILRRAERVALFDHVDGTFFPASFGHLLERLRRRVLRLPVVEGVRRRHVQPVRRRGRHRPGGRSAPTARRSSSAAARDRRRRCSRTSSGGPRTTRRSSPSSGCDRGRRRRGRPAGDRPRRPHRPRRRRRPPRRRRRCATGPRRPASPRCASGRSSSSSAPGASPAPACKVATVVNFPAGTDPADASGRGDGRRRRRGRRRDRRRAAVHGVAGRRRRARRRRPRRGARRRPGARVDEGDHRDGRAARPLGDRPGRDVRHRARRRLRQDVDRQDGGVGDAGGGRDRARGDRRVRAPGRVQGVGRHPHRRRRRAPTSTLADSIMGPEWATPATFRFGASSLLDALEAALPSDPSECFDASECRLRRGLRTRDTRMASGWGG